MKKPKVRSQELEAKSCETPEVTVVNSDFQLPTPNFYPVPFACALSNWFNAAQRDLPWRRADIIENPYRILVSEVMLQQTTVAAVAPFFERFIARFPNVQSLAEADESDVLAQWAGLGYYARARNLQKAARAVVDEHGGEFPRGFDAILALPGVGRYTAGAVASIAYGARAPIVDANVARVLSRVLPVEGDLKKAAAQTQLWEAATRIVEVDEVKPREINSALMELGALVCTPKKPQCEVCPVAQFCVARAENRQNELPVKTPKKAPTLLFDVCALALNERGEVLLRRRPNEAGVWWRGMWELPRVTRRDGENQPSALQRLGDELGARWHKTARFATLKHGVTRYQIELECWIIEVQSVELNDGLRWFAVDEALRLPLPSTMKTLLQRIEADGGTAPARQLNLWAE